MGISSPSFLSRADASLRLVLGVAAVAIALAVVLPYQSLMDLMAETGPIERATVLLYLGAAVLLLLSRRGGPLSLRLPLGVMMCAFAARELDLHKAWTGFSVLKVSYYYSPAPWQHRLVALAVLLPVALSLLWLLWRWGRPSWAALQQRHPVAITVAVFFGTMLFSKLVDRSENVLLEDFGYQFAPWMSALRASLEELLELTLPLLVMLGARQQRRSPALRRLFGT